MKLTFNFNCDSMGLVPEELDVVVIGAGFAGLATGAALRARGVRRFAILEQGDDVGHFWSKTYDRLHLHSAWHDLPHDGGASARYPMFKARDDLIDYFRGYALRHGLAEHLRFGERVLRITQLGSGRGDDADWRIETGRRELAARYLAVATAINRAPQIPPLVGREGFSGRVLHSSEYRNAEPFRGRRMLVVGSGNSAAEISLDLAQGGAGAVSMWVRGPRHFIPLRWMRRIFRTVRLLGQFSEPKMDARHRITFGTPEFEQAIAGPDRIASRFSADLSRYGIRRPERGPAFETFRNGRIPTYDVGAIEEIRRGRIHVIDGNERPIEGFEEEALRIGGDRERFDAVILATGFQPKLEEFLGEPRMLGPVRWLKRSALTDGRSRSSVLPSAFFPGFDPTPIGGLSLGRWGWEAGERIAEALA